LPEETQTAAEQVRQRAYAIWEAEGRPDGRSQEFWDRAERELAGSGAAETVVAVYSSEASAQAACRDLQENGVSANQIQSYSGVKGAAAFEPQDQDSGSLMDWLLGEESPVRDKSIYRSAGGSHMVAVATGSTDLSRIISILQAHAPSNIEELGTGRG
jgi:hypothetical protein